MKTSKKPTKKIITEFTSFNSLLEVDAIKFINKDDSFLNTEKILALCLEEDLTTDDLDSIIENGNHHFGIGNKEWIIVTDQEGDELWDEHLDNYIDDCVMSEIPKYYQNYFDSEKFKQDCKFNGRGHSLAGYDGYENTQNVNGTTYYIYRTN